jgi:hypothetical protein
MSDSNLARNGHLTISANNAFDSDGFYEFITIIHDKVTSELDSPTTINYDYKSIVDNNIGAKDSMTAIRRGPASKEKLANDYGMLSYEE